VVTSGAGEGGGVAARTRSKAATARHAPVALPVRVTCELVREWLRRVAAEAEANDGEEGDADSNATDSDSGDDSENDVPAGLEEAALGVGTRRRKFAARQSPFMSADAAASLGILRDAGGSDTDSEGAGRAVDPDLRDVMDMVKQLQASGDFREAGMRSMFTDHSDSDQEDGDGADGGSDDDGVNPALVRRWENEDMNAIAKWVEVEDAGCGGVTMPGIPPDPILAPLLELADPDHVAAVNAAAAAALAAGGGGTTGAVVVPEEEAVMLKVRQDAAPLTTLLVAMARGAGGGDPLLSHLVGAVRGELQPAEAEELGTRLQQAMAAGM
jgi:hypothetical protein